ncbi:MULTISPECIES: antibiotic ABC transporter permease [Halorubrum]|uniref:Antibiotic ABC transporter permease n=1 Tax=Halorubrum ruber TaxID=2982524 RepID=A0A8T8LIM7_9EURY|nr:MULTISPECIES: antibiotic ABC transporter permease [Halorubrum]QUO46877.1 antibiotic ABC transporter permease [Halorubrum ruber]
MTASGAATRPLETPERDGEGRRVTDDEAARALEATLAYAREREYTGWDYFDGMSSRFRRWLPVENKWLNIAVQEGIKRFPVNVRRPMLVEQRQSFKGTALFVMANRAAAERAADEGAPESNRLDAEGYRREADRLSAWLVENRSRGYAGFCGGHQHATQGLDERLPARHPGIVSTGYAVRALLSGSEASGEGTRVPDRFDGLDLDAAGSAEGFAAVAESALPFVFEDLNYRETGETARIDYHASAEPGETTVINANAIGARLLLDLHARRPRPELRERAERILDYVAERQAPIGGWYYTDPPSASHLSMDNHHNGFVLESLLRYREVTGSTRYDETLERGLRFYRETLFEPSGAPNWDETSAYPKDVHAAAEGIVLFSAAGDTAFASRILDWTLSELYAGDGRFRYQKRRFYTKRFTLMRWCQAWMAFALGEYLRARRREESSKD